MNARETANLQGVFIGKGGVRRRKRGYRSKLSDRKRRKAERELSEVEAQKEKLMNALYEVVEITAGGENRDVISISDDDEEVEVKQLSLPESREVFDEVVESGELDGLVEQVKNVIASRGAQQVEGESETFEIHQQKQSDDPSYFGATYQDYAAMDRESASYTLVYKSLYRDGDSVEDKKSFSEEVSCINEGFSNLVEGISGGDSEARRAAGSVDRLEARFVKQSIRENPDWAGLRVSIYDVEWACTTGRYINHVGSFWEWRRVEDPGFFEGPRFDSKCGCWLPNGSSGVSGSGRVEVN